MLMKLGRPLAGPRWIKTLCSACGQKVPPVGKEFCRRCRPRRRRHWDWRRR